MKRREFIGFLGAASWVFSASAQPSDPVRRIGLLMSYAETDPEAQQRLAAFRQSLEQAGSVADQGARIDVRWHAGDPERAKADAKEIVALKPDVIVANGTPALSAARDLTTSIPIVFVVVTNPVGAGYVPNLSKPGANITGFSTFEPEIGGKWLEILADIAPQTKRVGILTDRTQTGFARLWQAIEASAPSFGMDAMVLDAPNGPAIDRVIDAIAQRPHGGLVVLPNPINSVQRERLYALAERHHLPAIYPFAFHARGGGLVAYGFDAVDLFRRAGAYVHRILKRGEARRPSRAGADQVRAGRQSENRERTRPNDFLLSVSSRR
jgi:putative ABC transport system substrate-binding protein